MRRSRLSEIIGWLAICLGLVVVLRAGRAEGSWPLVIVAAAAVATAAIVIRRSLTALTQLQALLVEGRPAPMLGIVRRRLRYRGGGKGRAPLLIYKAAALSMSGDWTAGLKVLAELNVPDDLPAEERQSWQFAHDSTKFGCLIFAEQIDEARSLFEEKLESYRGNPTLGTTIVAMEAQLHFCEGEHILAERAFEEIVDDANCPPVTRGFFHYFLGRIYFDRGQNNRAARQFDLARGLAAKTWIPAGIDALDHG